jgi:hypothetical protein
MHAQLAESSIELVRTCSRCGFTLPAVLFEPSRSTCTECRLATPVMERVGAVAADYLLRCHAARQLLRLGLTVAAEMVLANPHGWPTIAEARRMQMRAA